jgi:hypothetical protein
MKPIYTTIKVTDKTQTQKLPFMEQLKLLLGKVSSDENIKLEASEKISKANLEMQSALSNLIDNVTSRMKELGENSATVSVSSRFKPYFDDVLSPKSGKGRFYDFKVIDKEMPVIGVDYFLTLKIKEREG